MKLPRVINVLVILLAMPNTSFAGESAPDNVSATAPEGWTTESPRDEIRPHFSFEPSGGPDAACCFVIKAKGHSECMGQWTSTVPVVGGQHFSFRALRKADGIETPRRNTLVRITWQDDQGGSVSMGPGNYLSPRASTKQRSQNISTGVLTAKEESKADSSMANDCPL